MKRYLLRSLKYFVKLVLTLVLILACLAAAKMIPTKVDEIFVNGYDSLWQIALIIAALSLFYPKFGYGRRAAFLPGEPSEIEGKVVKSMVARGYVPEGAGVLPTDRPSSEGKPLVFRSSSTFQRIFRLGEDRITMEKTATGYEIEGKVKDITRVAAFLETVYSAPDEL